VTEEDVPPARHYLLEPGHIFIPAGPTIISVVLGSSVAVCLFDRKRQIGGINHFQLPHIREKHKATAIYGNVATITLIRMMVHDGSKIKHLEAQILGGAFNPAVSERNVGRENTQIARRVLLKERINIASEDCGGERGRKIVFNAASGEVAVFKADRLRQSDWFPYEGIR
jgi:chemotaxis protein CheD